MKTISCHITNSVNVSYYLRAYNNVLRIAYNRTCEGMSQPEIKKYINPKFEGLNSFIIQNAICQAQGIYKRTEDLKLIFGGKNNLKRYLKKLITKEEYKTNKQSPILISGENRHYGNRLFDFDFQNNTVWFKPKKGIKIEIKYNCGNKQKEELLQLQELCDKKEGTIAVSFNNDKINFIFDETQINKHKHFKKLKTNRIIGIDLNPNYIGLSIIEFDKNDEFKVLHKQVYNLKLLTKQNKKNKKKFELYQINHGILKLCNYWKCSTIAIEELNIKHKSLNQGRKNNKLVLNDWCRNLTILNLKLLANKYGVKLVEVNPAYSSKIGNILYGDENTPDMVTASIEIARRAYKKFIKGWFYPDFNKSLNLLNEQWKQTLEDNFIQNWKELFTLIKNSKLKYRVLLENTNCSRSFSFNNKKSLSFIMIFNKSYY